MRDTPGWDAARRCGRLLAERGFVVATGGYGGIMEATSEGARSVGGHVIGITAPAVFPGRSGANPFVAEEHSAPTIGTRIARLIESTSGSIVLPGSIGTATELMVAWNAAFVSQFSGAPTKPVVAVGEPWAELVPLLMERLGLDDRLVELVDTVEDAVEGVAAALQA